KRQRDGVGARAYIQWFIVAAILVAGGSLTFFIADQRSNIEPDTFCDRRGPSGVEMILIDASDSLDEVQIERAKSIVASKLQQLSAGTRVDIFVATHADGSLPAPVFSKCNPGKPGRYAGVYRDAESLREDYEQEYMMAIEREIGSLLGQPALENSPILESIRSAATRSFGRVESDVPKSMIIISDMLQNSDLDSHYRDDISISSFLNSERWPQAMSDLHQSDVEILYVLRPQYRDFQGAFHLNWWDQYLRSIGAKSISVRSI
ncbi:MAG: hypothetical protein VXW22_16155, partial [Pseudomonadota bacterium]|nr:hypothetical protein [Pseudomonadota bacterium]